MSELIPLEQRRAAGIFYTPVQVVRFIVDRALTAWRADHSDRMPSVLDPACGDGAFLRGAAALLGPAASESLFGIDTDATALREAGMSPQLQSANLVYGNALVETKLPNQTAPHVDCQHQFPQIMREGGFDLIVGNPPYLNIRRLARHQSEETNRYLRARYRCAFGCFDLFTLFIERAWQLLRPGGVCGFIVPNKIATLGYAKPCRELLRQRTHVLEVIDASAAKVFHNASVYPYIVLFRKREPQPDAAVSVTRVSTFEDLPLTTSSVLLPQSALKVDEGWQLHGSLNVESRVATRPLGECCRLSSGATGFVAERLAEALKERDSCDRLGFEFIVSGNIDRYVIKGGNVRFMGRRFQRPWLPVDCDAISSRKRTLYDSPKVVIAGMSRRLEAAWDADGRALGVQAYAATDFEMEHEYLLGILNSRLLSYLFRQRFQAKRLSGNYLSINLRQLAQLPFVVGSVVQREQIAGWVRRRLSARSRKLQEQLEEQIDEAVEALYHLTAKERGEVAAHFGQLEPPSAAPSILPASKRA